MTIDLRRMCDSPSVEIPWRERVLLKSLGFVPILIAAFAYKKLVNTEYSILQVIIFFSIAKVVFLLLNSAGGMLRIMVMSEYAEEFAKQFEHLKFPKTGHPTIDINDYLVSVIEDDSEHEEARVGAAIMFGSLSTNPFAGTLEEIMYKRLMSSTLRYYVSTPTNIDEQKK